MADTEVTASESQQQAPLSSSSWASCWGLQVARVLAIVGAVVLRCREQLSEEWTVLVIVAPFSSAAIDWLVAKLKK